MDVLGISGRAVEFRGQTVPRTPVIWRFESHLLFRRISLPVKKALSSALGKGIFKDSGAKVKENTNVKSM
jgi:hypothetical protein